MKDNCEQVLNNINISLSISYGENNYES